MKPILLSPPEAGTAERDAVREAIDSGWLAPAGPALTAFEEEMAAVVGRRRGVALSSGTAALHLALIAHGVGPGDDVLVSDFTFAASVNAITYVGANPVLIDSDAATWNMAVDLLTEELDARRSHPPKAAVVVDLYGQPADHERIAPLLAQHGVLHIADAAESLGATCAGRPAAAHGASAVLSFNGNKIITTTGGGMLVTDDDAVADRVRHLSTQAREQAPHYENVEVGYNYRLSNLLAAFGRAQLADLERRVERRREIFDRYEAGLSSLTGLGFMPEAPYGRSNRTHHLVEGVFQLVAELLHLVLQLALERPPRVDLARCRVWNQLDSGRGGRSDVVRRGDRRGDVRERLLIEEAFELRGEVVGEPSMPRS